MGWLGLITSHAIDPGKLGEEEVTHPCPDRAVGRVEERLAPLEVPGRHPSACLFAENGIRLELAGQGAQTTAPAMAGVDIDIDMIAGIEADKTDPACLYPQLVA